MYDGFHRLTLMGMTSLNWHFKVSTEGAASSVHRIRGGPAAAEGMGLSGAGRALDLRILSRPKQCRELGTVAMHLDFGFHRDACEMLLLKAMLSGPWKVFFWFCMQSCFLLMPCVLWQHRQRLQNGMKLAFFRTRGLA